MKLAALDLNLLVPLEALLRVRNVTHASVEVGISQPAMSAALRRLRRHFGDELLHRVGSTYVLTPVALRVLDDLGLALEFASRALSAAPSFDPSTVERTFSIVTSDYALCVLGQSLLARVTEAAPRLQINFEVLPATAFDDMELLLSSRDLVLFPRGYLNMHLSQDLFADRWVCLVSSTNTLVGDTMTEDDIERLGWIVMYHRKTAYLLPDRVLDIRHPGRRVEVVLESFLNLPQLVAGTERVALIQHRLAERLAPLAPTRVLPCPVDLDPLHEAMWWHTRHDLDPAHVWLRRQLATASADLPVLDPPL